MMRITCSSFWKRDLGQFDLAGTLDIDLARAVDHHLGDALVAQQWLERTEADDLVGDLLEHARSLGAGERKAFGIKRAAEGLLDLAPYLDLVGQVELWIEVGDDPLLDAELGITERLAQRNLGEHSAGGRRRRAVPAPLVGAGTAALLLADAGVLGVGPSRPGGGVVGAPGGGGAPVQSAGRPGTFDATQAATFRSASS